MTDLASRVWSTMSPINVNDMTEKKGNLTYLSWASAVEILGKHFPDHDFDTQFEKFDDGTVMVYSQLIIRDGEESYTRRMWLPVMDHRNNAIPNPDARKISDAMMRCLAKNISVATGLGLYVYRGEDIPSAEAEAKKTTINQDQAKLLAEAVEHSGKDLGQLFKAYRVNNLNELTNQQFDDAMARCQAQIAQNAATEQQDDVLEAQNRSALKSVRGGK
jgi:hypothetical protein